MSLCEKHVRRTCTLRRFNEARELDLYFNNRINGLRTYRRRVYTRAERRRTALKRSTIGLTRSIKEHKLGHRKNFMNVRDFIAAGNTQFYNITCSRDRYLNNI